MKKRGIGFATMFYGTGYGNGFPDVSTAIAELRKDGKIAIYVGASEVGQGAKTIMSQIPAEILGVQVEDIIFICEDTSITPDAGTAAASRQTYNTGNAIKKAAEALREEIIKIAVEMLAVNSDTGLVVKEGKVYIKTFPSQKVTFTEIAEKTGDGLLRKEATFIAHSTQMDEETGQGSPYWPYTFGACGVEVEVDTETGYVEIIKATVAQDVGKAINPSLIEGQIDGGFAMGYGYAILENLNVVKGQIKGNRFANYLIPTAMDMPEVDKIIVEDPESTGPFGAKGIGEPVMVYVAPAILNAIYNAIGVRMTEIPVTPEKLLKALNEKN